MRRLVFTVLIALFIFLCCGEETTISRNMFTDSDSNSLVCIMVDDVPYLCFIDENGRVGRHVPLADVVKAVAETMEAHEPETTESNTEASEDTVVEAAMGAIVETMNDTTMMADEKSEPEDAPDPAAQEMVDEVVENVMDDALIPDNSTMQETAEANDTTTMADEKSEPEDEPEPAEQEMVDEVVENIMDDALIPDNSTMQETAEAIMDAIETVNDPDPGNDSDTDPQEPAGTQEPAGNQPPAQNQPEVVRQETINGVEVNVFEDGATASVVQYDLMLIYKVTSDQAITDHITGMSTGDENISIFDRAYVFDRAYYQTTDDEPTLFLGDGIEPLSTDYVPGTNYPMEYAINANFQIESAVQREVECWNAYGVSCFDHSRGVTNFIYVNPIAYGNGTLWRFYTITAADGTTRYTEVVLDNDRTVDLMLADAQSIEWSDYSTALEAWFEWKLAKDDAIDFTDTTAYPTGKYYVVIQRRPDTMLIASNLFAANDARTPGTNLDTVAAVLQFNTEGEASTKDTEHDADPDEIIATLRM